MPVLRRRSGRTGGADGRPICLVGPGTRFLSGITYYTFGLANALARHRPVSVVLLRGLLPARLYPGRRRVGADVSRIELRPNVPRFDGIDWYWLPSAARAVWFLLARRPRVLVLQWWTATALHTYLLIALVARALGVTVVIEFHEVLDTGEERFRPVRAYVRTLAPRLFRLAAGSICHSQFERDAVVDRYGLPGDRIEVVPHPAVNPHTGGEPIRLAPDGVCNILYFGVIRPFKGVEDLIGAFDGLSEEQASRYWLTLVGETWEGWDLPVQLAAASRHRDRISFVNRYVDDEEADGFFRGSDVVVLPYHRSSQSGPLHVAMSLGLPVVVSAVGGLVEAVEDYGGALLAPPASPDELRAALVQSAELAGRRFENRRGWGDIIPRYSAAVDALTARAEAA
ncbi:MAG TPA: glycosyltransferase family 4 protein [Gaiellales bacterium]|nr:glycosyltransferase family 4 protein [Gaiellales bacterium]